MGSAPETAALPALRTQPKYIFFTDFDGTITQQDSNDYLTDNLGYGTELRKQGNADVLEGKVTFRDSFHDMMESVAARVPYDECVRVLRQNITLDPRFPPFFAFAREHNIPVVVLSGGMRPIIEALLGDWLGREALAELQIVCNDVGLRPGHASINEVGGWELVFHDDSHFGHDKSLEIRPYAQLPDDQRPLMFYAGDGVSDLSAAKETDLLFAKAGKDLVTFCEREGVPFTTFDDFSDILASVKEIVEGRVSIKGAATGRN